MSSPVGKHRLPFFRRREKSQARPMTTKAQLIELSNIIADAVKVVIAEYDAIGQAPPSLDSPVAGPFDAPEDVPLKLSKAVRTIEAACAQLSFSVASPGHVMTNKAYGFYEPACMLVVSDAKIADLLLDKPEGVPVAELAEKSGLDEGKLGRVMRTLVTKHVFNEVKPNVFSNNRLSIKLVSTDPVRGLLGHMCDEVQRSSASLSDVLLDPVHGKSYAAESSPFVRAHGTSIFDYYATDEGKKRIERFHQAMIGWGAVTGKGLLPKIYPWGEVPVGTSVCDVGGGNGHITLDLLKVNPRMKIFVQDLPEALEQGKELWTKELPSAIQNSSVEFVPLDFFKDTPVAGCDFYYVRHVLHDWPDADCIKILTNIKQAVKPSSRLLIHEYVLQHVVRQDNQAGIDQAPEPLLPNYGMGKVRMYQQDINMMNIFNSKERTLDEFISMGEKTGFKFVKLWDSGETSLVEFSVA